MYKRLILMAALLLSACSSEDVPPAHKGMMFDRTGTLAGWSGGKGLTGDVLGPGTYWTGIYDDVYAVRCGVITEKEQMTALTKSGVQFTFDVYVRFHADCTDDAVKYLLKNLQPDDKTHITGKLLYTTYIRPSLGSASREAMGPYEANDINPKRETIWADVLQRFQGYMVKQKPRIVEVQEMSLSNMDFPKALDEANELRAVQSIQRDASVAEREKIAAQTTTAEGRIKLASTEAQAEAARIAAVGEALRRYPEYLAYQQQQQLPGIYKDAGAHGNMIITAPTPQVFIQPRHPGGLPVVK